FGLLALLAYAFYVQRPSIRRYLLVALGMVFSLLAKPMWVTLPAMLLLLDYWPLRRWPLAAQGASKRVSFKWLLLEKTPLALLSVATVPITLWAQQTGGALRSLAHVPFSQRLANSLVSYGEYLRQLVWPRDLACFYPYPQHGVSIALTVTIAVLLVLVTVAVLRWSRKCPYLPVGWLWYLGTLVPVLGLVTIGLAARADRYTYVPFIGIFVALVWGTADLAQWVGHARRAAAVGCAIVVSCMLLSWVQVQVWADSITLWTHDIAVVGGTDIGHSNLASAYEAVGNVKEAVKQYEAAIACNRDYAPAHGALGLLWLHHGQPAKAAEQFKAALRTDPEPARSHANLGQALLQQGEVDEAVREFKETLRLRPQDRATRLVLAGTLFHGGHVDEAAQLLDEGIRLDPDAAELQQLRGVIYLQGRLMRQAEAYFHRAAELRPDNALYHRSHAYTLNALGRPEEAKAEYQESVRLDPNWPKLALTRAWLLSTAPDGSQRDAATAVLEAEQGRQAMGDQDPHVLDILAAAYANAGRFPEAVAAARLAKARAEALQQTEFATELGRRLRLFEHKQPFRTAAPPSANLPPSR
ncbi:MAG TPA: tetratricopeptide repeat protein, partial [Gemmataceae bacterium]|nr:tetratricopeptide repeat protein [Gemmataceae bacterium]